MEKEEAERQIKTFLDENGRLTSFPSKRKKKIIALIYLASKIDPKKIYTEKEFNALLDEWNTFGDHATLRRELFDYWFIDRESNGHCYRLCETLPDDEKLGLNE